MLSFFLLSVFVVYASLYDKLSKDGSRRDNTAVHALDLSGFNSEHSKMVPKYQQE